MKRTIHANKQRGAVLLALILVIVAGSAWMLLDNLNFTTIQNQRDKHDARVLAEAKQALIDYAVTYSDIEETGNFGYLPCPDRYGGGAIDEGGSDGNCGVENKNVLGRLPWRTLGLQPLKDSSGECLWYALSSQYRPDSLMVNSDTNGTFEIYNSNSSSLIAGAGGSDNYGDRPVAVIFAPGESVSDQNRQQLHPTETPECGGNYIEENYLDEVDLGGALGVLQNHTVDAVGDIDHLVSGRRGDGLNFNDKAVYITKENIWNALHERKDINYISLPDPQEFKRLTAWVSGCLADYAMRTGSDPANHSLPSPAAPNLITNLNARDYRDNSVYRSIDSAELDSYYIHSYINPPLFGRLPFDVENSADIKGISINNNSFIDNCDLSGSVLIEETSIKHNNQKYRNMWQNWKDHFFYIIADLYSPKSTWERVNDPSNVMTGFCASLPRNDWPDWLNEYLENYCDNYFSNNPGTTIPRTCDNDSCITIENKPNENYAGVVIFSGVPHDHGTCGIDPSNIDTYTDQRRINISYDRSKTESNDDRKRVCNYIERPNLNKLITWDTGKIDYVDTNNDDSLLLNKPDTLYSQNNNDIYYCLKTSSASGSTSIIDITECFE